MIKPKQYNEVEKLISILSESFFEGKIHEIIENLQNLKVKNKEYHTLWISLEYDYENTHYELRGKRYETDEEYEKRMTNEKLKKARLRREAKANKQAEYEEYLRLKEKYEKQ